MNLQGWLVDHGLETLKINIKFLQAEFKIHDLDKEAAWELYIELLTRITTQPLPEDSGDNKTALESVYSLFPLTREVIKRKGPGCLEFTKIAIVVLNQVIRPFTAKWHKLSLECAFEIPEKVREFREELADLQEKLRVYTRALAAMADVEDLTALENEEPI
ncbi:MAG: hypothetical protein OXP71_01495 [Candidatus Poribacteria bacterium]|nr:hypothetical protein [Candidatus Poribacteria bacterium]